jgi:hypothetical protein
MPRFAGKRVQVVVIATTVLFASLPVFLSPASSVAAPGPATSGQATISLAPTFSRRLKKAHVKVMTIAPATLVGTVVSFPGGGSLDPIAGQVTVGCAGGLEFRRGKRVARVTELEVGSSKDSIEGNLGSGKVPIATADFAARPDGFGEAADSGPIHLTKSVALTVDKRLRLSPKTSDVRPKNARHRRPKTFRRKRRTRMPALVSGEFLGVASIGAQPGVVAITPGDGLTILLDPSLVAKLRDVEVVISGATQVGTPPAESFLVPLAGGSFDIATGALTAHGEGALRFEQRLEAAGVVVGAGTVTVANPSLDLSSSTLEVDLTGESSSVPWLDFGPLQQTALGGLAAPIGSVTAHPEDRSVGLSTSAVDLSSVGAQMLDGFRRLYEDRRGVTRPQDVIRPGEPLGAVYLSAQVE